MKQASHPGDVLAWSRLFSSRRGSIRRRSITVVFATLVSILFSFSALASDACVEEQEPNESPETAQAFSGNFCVQGTISEFRPVDFCLDS